MVKHILFLFWFSKQIILSYTLEIEKDVLIRNNDIPIVAIADTKLGFFFRATKCFSPNNGLHSRKSYARNQNLYFSHYWRAAFNASKRIMEAYIRVYKKLGKKKQ